MEITLQKNYKVKNNQKNSNNIEQPLYAPGTRISYDAKLVPRLIMDHEELVRIYTKIVDATTQQEYKNLSALLEMFLAVFNAHALAEYTKLYIFLDYSFRFDRVSHGTIKRFRKEMNDIGKAVREFSHYWRKHAIDNNNVHEFTAQIEKIGGVLVKRIEVEEEQLYAFYDSAPRRLAQSNRANL